MRRAWRKLRLRLGWLIMPPEIKSISLKPELPGLEVYTLEDVAQGRAPGLMKRPSPLWENRREAMFKFGYDPRNTAQP